MSRLGFVAVVLTIVGTTASVFRMVGCSQAVRVEASRSQVEAAVKEAQAIDRVNELNAYVEGWNACVDHEDPKPKPAPFTKALTRAR